MKFLATGLLLAAMALPASASETVNRFYGYAFDLKTDRYLYTEVHSQELQSGRWVRGQIAYFGADGRKLGSKSLDFSADPFIPLYDYQLPGQGYREGITRIDGSVALTKTDDGKTRTNSVPKADPITGDSGFHNFLVSRFDELMSGKTVAFTFVAAGNLDSYKFRARRIEDVSFEGRKAVRFMVEANSLLRIVAPNLVVTYDPERKRLLEYRGPSNVIDPATDKVYEARIAYYSTPPAQAPKPLPPLE